MWWRSLGVAFVLLVAGALGGYAVADRTADGPALGSGAEPVPAVSPAVPTPPAQEVRPDPAYPALEPDLPSIPVDLRISKKDAGLQVAVPDGWNRSRGDSSNRWTFAPAGSPVNTYGLRVNVIIGQNVSVPVALASRIVALQATEDEGNIDDLQVTQTGNAFEASYVDDGYLRQTMEEFISFDGGPAYAEIAVTGRAVDEEGLRDLLSRVADSAVALPASERVSQ